MCDLPSEFRGHASRSDLDRRFNSLEPLPQAWLGGQPLFERSDGMHDRRMLPLEEITQLRERRPAEFAAEPHGTLPWQEQNVSSSVRP